MDELKLINKMMEYYRGDPKRIQHFLKVYDFSVIIGRSEQTNLSKEEQMCLETAALVHDIGIKKAEEKYGNCSGKLQEKEGVEEAKQMLSELGYDERVIERVCYLVGHHHTYDAIDGLDYQILVEADFLVNMYEDALDDAAVRTAYEKIFKTEEGKRICKILYMIYDK